MKPNKTKYGLISRDNMTTILYFPCAIDTACYLVNRKMDRFIILKITSDSAKVVELVSANTFKNVGALTEELANA